MEHHQITNGPDGADRKPCECLIGKDHLVEGELESVLEDTAAEHNDRITGLAPPDATD